MSTEPIITRIYKISVEGYDEAIQRVQRLNKEFKALDETKKKLNDSLKVAIDNNATADIAKLNAELAKLQTQQSGLQKEIKTTARELEMLDKAYAGLVNKTKVEIPPPDIVIPATAPIETPTVEVNQYVKSLAEVNRLQVENQLQLNANRQAQKALTQEISAAGNATEQQISLLATLRGEQVQLQQKGKEYAVTERNLTNELQAQDGAVVKLSAQLNVLRQTYDRLSEGERNSDAGKSQLLNIQQLDTALKALDAQQGRFNRSVGDYKQQYNGLNVAIQQILRETPSAAVSLNTFFLAISNNLPLLFDELQKAQAATKAANLASREAAAAAKTEAINRAVAAGATIQQATAEGLLAEKTALANAAQTKSPSLLNQITSSLFSVNTVLTLVVLGLTLFGSKIVDAVSGLFKTKSAVSALNDTYGELNKVIAEANKGAGQQLVNAKALLQSATDLNIPIAKRLEYAKELKKEFPQLLANIDAEAIANGKAKVSYEELSKSILDNAKARAAQNRIGDYASQLLTVEDNIAKINAITKVQAAAARDRTITISGSGTGTGGTTYTETAADQRAEIEERRKNSVSLQEIEKKRLEDRIAFFTRFAGGEEAIARSIVDSHQKQQKEAKDHVSKLDALTQDALKLIDAERNRRLDDAETDIVNLRRTNQSSYEAELKYLLAVQEINETAINKKQTILERIKNKNEEEKETYSKLGIDRANIESKTQDAIVALRKKESDRLKELSDQEYNYLENELQRRQDLVTDDPNSTKVQQLQAQQEYLAGLLILETLNYQEKQAIDKRFGTIDIAEQKKHDDKILKLHQDKNKTDKALTIAQYDEQLELIKERGNREILELRRQTLRKTAAILGDDSTTNAQKKKLLSDLERDQTLAAYDLEYQDLLRQQTRVGISKKEFDKLEEDQIANRQARLKLSADKEKTYFDKIADNIKGVINNITGFFKGQKAIQADIDKSIEAAVNITKDVINQAYVAYFDRQKQKIEDEKETATERLKIEEDQALFTAQSEAEKDSIKRQFDAKRKELDKKAAEERKQLALKQLSIDFALAVVKTLAAYPFPFSLIPVAALGLAYAVQRSAISQQKFAKGGYTGRGREIDETGHRVAGIVHQNEWVAPEWMATHPKYGRTVAALEAVRQRGYADGGYVSGLTVPGAFLRPPTTSSNFLLDGSSGGSSEAMAAIRQVAKTVDTLAKQTNERIDKIQVINNPNATVSIANKYAVANNVATI